MGELITCLHCFDSWEQGFGFWIRWDFIHVSVGVYEIVLHHVLYERLVDLTLWSFLKIEDLTKQCVVNWVVRFFFNRWQGILWLDFYLLNVSFWSFLENRWFLVFFLAQFLSTWFWFFNDLNLWSGLFWLLVLFNKWF